MNMLKKKLLVLFLIVGNLIFSQQKEVKNIKLKWIEAIDFVISKNNKIKTSIIEGNFVDENLNPTFSDSWKVENGTVAGSYTINNIVFETVLKRDYKLYNTKHLSDKLNLNFNIVKSRNNSSAILNITPLIKEGNTIKRIISFNLEYTLTASKKNNVAKSSTVKNSVLASGEWYKFAIDTTGVYKIDRDFLQNLGINVNSINPKNIKIYGNGGEMLPFKNSDFRNDGLQEMLFI